MDNLVVSKLEAVEDTVEIVERKGLGHPDTICDALAETLTRNLCREYRHRFGTILHHNVDKALLCGGRSAPAFGGGEVLVPINIYLAGRATAKVGSENVPIREIAVEGSRAWMRANLHALDAERHVTIHELIQPVSRDLQDLFIRRGDDVPLANDTSIGVGFAPLSPLERLVLAIEKRINGRDCKQLYPAWGEDVKVMGIRRGCTIHLIVSCAMIGRHISDMKGYLAEKAALERLVRTLAVEQGMPECEISINAADAPSTGAIYLTVTGISGEAGDDGQVGRGNRVNGLITPCRPMSLEAAAGKNPVTHVGKLYNVVAREIAELVLSDLPAIEAAQCFIVSRIGVPITNPAVLQVKLATRGGAPTARYEGRVAEIAADRLARMPDLIERFIAGSVEVF